MKWLLLIALMFGSATARSQEIDWQEYRGWSCVDTATQQAIEVRLARESILADVVAAHEQLAGEYEAQIARFESALAAARQDTQDAYELTDRALREADALADIAGEQARILKRLQIQRKFQVAGVTIGVIGIATFAVLWSTR